MSLPPPFSLALAADREPRGPQHFQRSLELDYALDESERLRRWEERLAWEQLDEAERALRYSEYASTGALATLGLAEGWWGRRYGGANFDLSYLRDVPVSRGLFAPTYRSAFSRYPGAPIRLCDQSPWPDAPFRALAGVARRFAPYFSPQRLRGYAGGGSVGGVGLGRGGMPINPHLTAPYHSQKLSFANGTGLSLREQELRSRLRIAEMRGLSSLPCGLNSFYPLTVRRRRPPTASLTGLSPAQRAAALSDARAHRAQLNAESRATRSVDRLERRSDALLAAQEAEVERAEMRDEVEEQRGIARLERAAGDLVGRPLPGGFGGTGALPRAILAAREKTDNQMCGRRLRLVRGGLSGRSVLLLSEEGPA